MTTSAAGRKVDGSFRQGPIAAAGGANHGEGSINGRGIRSGCSAPTESAACVFGPENGSLDETMLERCTMAGSQSFNYLGLYGPQWRSK